MAPCWSCQKIGWLILFSELPNHQVFFFFFFFFFFLTSLLNFLQYCFCFMFWFFLQGMWDPSSLMRDGPCTPWKGKRFISKRTHQSRENETQIQDGELPSTSQFFLLQLLFFFAFFPSHLWWPYTVLIILWPLLKVLPWFLSNLRWDILCQDLGHTMTVLEKLSWPGPGQTSPPWWASPPWSYPEAYRQHPLLSS